jgi:hypothetical protein
VRPSASSSQVYPYLSDRFLLGCVAVYLATIIFEGPLRFGLYTVGGGSLLYARDLVAALPLAAAVAGWFTGAAVSVPVAAVLGILLVHMLAGLLQLPVPFQALFGLKTWIPFLMGMSIAPLLPGRQQILIRLSFIALLATAAGVLVNIFIEYPWIGLSYDTAFGETTGAKQWWTGDGLRLPGLTRSSVAAAGIALMSLGPVVSSKIGWAVRTLCIGLAGVTIYLTTSKGPLLAIPILLVQVTLLTTLRSKLLSGTFVATLAALCLVLPLTLTYLKPNRNGTPDILSSFMDRIEDEWPKAFRLFEHPGQVLWGRGLGGIGTAQSFGSEAAHQNSADNLMVYLIITFGIVGPLYVAIYVYRMLKYTSTREHDDFGLRLTHAWTAAFIADGIVTNMIEDAVTSATFGVLVGTVLLKQSRPFQVYVRPSVRVTSYPGR